MRGGGLKERWVLTDESSVEDIEVSEALRMEGETEVVDITSEDLG